MAKFLLFIVFSAVIIYISWPSLLDPRTHGFYRFFAFETLLALILLNVGTWFQDPFSLQQIISWSFLIASIFLAVHAFYVLRVEGKPQGSFEATTRLVTSGAFRYLRHPLYCSLLLLGAGAFLKAPSMTGVALLIGLLAFLTATAQMEERENLEHFGAEYAAYMRNTHRFIPFIF